MSAPKYFIRPNASSFKHEQSASWVVVFWTFEEPRTSFGGDKLKIKEKIVVINDAISVNVPSSKDSHLKTASVNLKITDKHYDKDIRPNDFMAVWMCRWEEDADKIVNRLINGKGPDLNGFDSGLKFIGKVKSVSKSVSVADSGAPDEVINIQASAFTELNMSVYVSRLHNTFNEGVGGAIENQSITNLGFLKYLDPQLFDAFLAQGSSVFKTPDEIITFFTKVFLGNGVSGPDIRKELSGVPDNIGNKIVMPKAVFQDIFNKNSASTRYIDNIYFYTGIEKYIAGNANENRGLLTPSAQVNGSFRTSPKLKGGILLSAGQFENIGIYDLYERYLNDVCNEIYTTLRYSADGGIKPSIVVRQLPFTSPQLDLIINKPNNTTAGSSGSAKITRPKGEAGLVTEFKNLPRWVVDKALIKSVNVGMGSVSHVNMVHIFTTPFWSSLSGLNQEAQANLQKIIQAQQYALGSIIYDEEDIKKNGLRAFIKECNFESIEFSDKASGQNPNIGSPFWSAMQADFLFNMHLKLSGRVSCYGIQEPICVGDNFELDGVVYHIEGVDHVAQVFPNGQKKFMTILTLSNGVWAEALESPEAFAKHYPTIGVPHTFEIYGLTEQQEGPVKAAKRLRGGK